MITSKNTVLYGYALWLIGRTEFGVPVDELRELMARWFFMAQITGRYSGSPETRGQEDLNRLQGLTAGDAAGFRDALNSQIATTLTDDWWLVSLPEDLHTSNIYGPAYTGYIAALTVLDADVLLATSKVKDWLDPAHRPVKGVEKHRLFPQAYLKSKLKISAARTINQVANQALVEWSDNINISDTAPTEYWPTLVAEKNIGDDRLRQQRWWHALPDGWTDLSYEAFLAERRTLIARVTREGFRKLSDPNYQPAPPPEEDATASASQTGHQHSLCPHSKHWSARGCSNPARCSSPWTRTRRSWPKSRKTEASCSTTTSTPPRTTRPGLLRVRRPMAGRTGPRNSTRDWFRSAIYDCSRLGVRRTPR